MADLYYKDPVAAAPLKMKSRQPADAIIPAHDVEKLPGTVETDIGASKGFLQTLAGTVTLGRVAVDLSSAVVAYLSNLPTLVTKLDSVIAGQAAPGAIYGGTKTVTTPGTRVPLSATSQPLTEGVLLRGLDANTQPVYPGNATVSSTANGTRLAAKEPVFIRANNANLIYLDAAVAGEGVTWVGW
jgi:hypothetical protein